MRQLELIGAAMTTKSGSVPIGDVEGTRMGGAVGPNKAGAVHSQTLPTAASMSASQNNMG